MAKPSPEFVFLLAALLCAAISAVYDVRSRRIPNFITLPSMVVGILLHGMLGGWRQSASAAAAGLICGLMFLLFYLAGGVGAGDVKLMTASGCLAGLPFTRDLLIWTGLAGGAMALGLAIYRGQFLRTLGNVGMLLAHHRKAGLSPHPVLNVRNAETLRLPYALAIAAGCALSLYLLVVKP
jgi:prepilin peptidase CpaA